MTAPVVSVIIPTYNMRRFIAEAIESALAQTYSPVEVIIVDDGSTDGTGDCVEERYSKRVRYVYQAKQGRGAARNYGLRLAQGEHIQFLDADDLLYPHKIEAQVTFLQEHPEYAAVYGHVLVAYEDDIEHPRDPDIQSLYVSGDILEQEIHRPFLWTNAVLVRRTWIERVGGFDETLCSNEDWDLWLRIAAVGGQFAYLPGKPVALYRRPLHVPNAKASVHLLSGVQVLTKLQQAIGDPTEIRRLRLREAIGHWIYGYGKSLADEEHRSAGIVHMLRSLVFDQRSLDSKLLTISLMAVLPPQVANASFQRVHRVKNALLTRLVTSTETSQ